MSREIGYTKEIAIEICSSISSSSKSLATIAREMNLTSRTVWRWLAEIPDFQELYKLAKQQQADYLAEEIIEIADEPSRDLVDAQDRKLRVHARQWYAGKLNTKKYGENRSLQVENTTRPIVTDTQFAALLEAAKGAIDRPVEDIDHEDIDG